MEKLFISHQKWYFNLDVLVHKVIFPNCILTWRVNNYVFRQQNISRRNESKDLEPCRIL